MNVERLNHLLRRCGKTKAQIADECRISKVTLDNALHGGDIRVSTLEAIAASVGVWPGALFDDPPAGTATATGDRSVAAVNSSVGQPIPPELWRLVEERDRQVSDLLSILDRLTPLGKSSAPPSDAPANG